MPELPEVETIVRDLQSVLPHHTITTVHLSLPRLVQSDPQRFLTDLPGRHIEEVGRRGKHILISLQGDLLLWVHLGMSGRLFLAPHRQPVAKHTHLILTFAGREYELRYWDPRTFGTLALGRRKEIWQHPRLRRLGPDLLQVSLPLFQDRLRSRKGKIKPLLLDQSFCAGLGNIYADESLFAAGIHPARPVSTLSDREIERLYRAIRSILHLAIAHGGSTVVNYTRGDGSPGTFRALHQVYRRQGEPCPRCGTTIVRIRLGGRGTYCCPRCQQ
ncbi:MAG: bifunctional DNA-formamidopyrimidine glycosylase/DNA-(apurinic or apyrimidinic site) lyase [Nitrospinota bacterium]|nr:MAG: bifunctional DNA-formamidopyrimidine glycosylase/DNA-(apurinic or apyrimidinic site) lyase [Nitrospinota bacterium]